MRTHVVFFISLVAGCTAGGEGDDDGGGPDAAPSAKCQEATQHSDFAWIQTTIFTASCTFSACHKGTAATMAGGLNLEAGMAYDELVGQPSTVFPSDMRVVAGQPDASYLLIAIGQMSGELPEGGTMPLNAPLLCGEKRDAIERWIRDGAQR